MEIDHIYVDIGALGTNAMVSNIVLRELRFEKQNEVLYRDVPNRYQPGCEITVNMATSDISKDNLEANSESINTPIFFSIPPGVSEIDFYFSDFMATDPEIEVSWKENWI